MQTQFLLDNKISIRILLTCLWLVMIGGCALNEPKTPETIVAKRAQARWDALIKGDLETAYQYLSPGYRKAKSFERYKRGIFGVGVWQAAKVDKVACEQPDVCKVTVLVTTRLALPRIGTSMESTTPVYERWIRDEQGWWHVPRE